MQREYELLLQGLIDLKDYDKSFVWIDENEKTLNECIDELMESVLQYSKTGHRNNTLVKFSDNHRNLHELYRTCIEKNIKIDEKTKRNITVKRITFGKKNKTDELLAQQFKGFGYLSFLESIHNIYDKEKLRRSLWLEFDSKINDDDFLSTIEEIKDKNINIKILTGNMLKKNIGREKINNYLENNSDYFQLTSNKQEYNVALSSKGKSFCDYLRYKDKLYSQGEIEEILYAYTEHLLRMVEWGVEEGKQGYVEIAIENNDIIKQFLPDIKGIIKRKIFRTCKKLRSKQKGLQICIAENDEIYDVIKTNAVTYSYEGGNEDEYYQRPEG